MKKSHAEILCEYGPFPGIDQLIRRRRRSPGDPSRRIAKAHSLGTAMSRQIDAAVQHFSPLFEAALGLTAIGSPPLKIIGVGFFGAAARRPESGDDAVGAPSR